MRSEEALRRLREPDELYGLGDMEQWAVYRRDDKNEAARVVFSVWDSGARCVFSGMENMLPVVEFRPGHQPPLLSRSICCQRAFFSASRFFRFLAS